MGDQLSEADAALIKRSITFGHTFVPGVHSLSSVDLARIIQAARSEGPHPESGEWVMVPRDPAMAMLNAAVDATGAGSGMSWNGRSPQTLFEAGYRAMIAAAPPPLKGEALPVAVTDEMVEAGAKALTQIIWEQSLQAVMGRKVTPSDLVTARARACLEAALLSRGEG